MLEMVVGSAHVAACRPYVYIGFSRCEHVAYVGQTRDRRGFMGRWVDHLSRDVSGSSFRRRLTECDELAFDRLADLRLLAWDLGSSSLFMSEDRSGREAVEYLVQTQLRSICGQLRPWLRIVSTVRTNPRTRMATVKDAAEQIAAEFQTHYAGL